MFITIGQIYSRSVTQLSTDPKTPFQKYYNWESESLKAKQWKQGLQQVDMSNPPASLEVRIDNVIYARSNHLENIMYETNRFIHVIPLSFLPPIPHSQLGPSKTFYPLSQLIWFNFYVLVDTEREYSSIID